MGRSCDAGQAMFWWELWSKCCPSEWPDLETPLPLSVPGCKPVGKVAALCHGTDPEGADHWMMCANSTPSPMCAGAGSFGLARPSMI